MADRGDAYADMPCWSDDMAFHWYQEQLVEYFERKKKAIAAATKAAAAAALAAVGAAGDAAVGVDRVVAGVADLVARIAAKDAGRSALAAADEAAAAGRVKAAALAASKTASAQAAVVALRAERDCGRAVDLAVYVAALVKRAAESAKQAAEFKKQATTAQAEAARKVAEAEEKVAEAEEKAAKAEAKVAKAEAKAAEEKAAEAEAQLEATDAWLDRVLNGDKVDSAVSHLHAGELDVPVPVAGGVANLRCDKDLDMFKFDERLGFMPPHGPQVSDGVPGGLEELEVNTAVPMAAQPPQCASMFPNIAGLEAGGGFMPVGRGAHDDHLGGRKQVPLLIGFEAKVPRKYLLGRGGLDGPAAHGKTRQWWLNWRPELSNEVPRPTGGFYVCGSRRCASNHQPSFMHLFRSSKCDCDLEFNHLSERCYVVVRTEAGATVYELRVHTSGAVSSKTANGAFVISDGAGTTVKLEIRSKYSKALAQATPVPVTAYTLALATPVPVPVTTRNSTKRGREEAAPMEERRRSTSPRFGEYV